MDAAVTASMAVGLSAAGTCVIAMAHGNGPVLAAAFAAVCACSIVGLAVETVEGLRTETLMDYPPDTTPSDVKKTGER